jgi:hypothetical protein
MKHTTTPRGTNSLIGKPSRQLKNTYMYEPGLESSLDKQLDKEKPKHVRISSLLHATFGKTRAKRHKTSSA